MSISTAAPPPKKKSSCGCFGCGCLIVIILVLLFAGLVGGLGYFGYKEVLTLTTTAPESIPTFTPTDAGESSTQQKITEFRKTTENHQSASLHLSSDEINTLISHDPEMAKRNIQTYVTMTGSEGRIQVSAPTDAMAQGLFPGRYINFDVTFELSFDEPAKSVILSPKELKIGDQTVLGPGSGNEKNDFRANLTKAYLPLFNQSFNQGLRKNPDVAKFLDNAKSIEIKDSELVIETK